MVSLAYLCCSCSDKGEKLGEKGGRRGGGERKKRERKRERKIERKGVGGKEKEEIG